MEVETRNAPDFFALCERIKRGEVRLISVTVGERNGWYVFNLADPPKPEPATANEVLKRLLH